MKKAIEINLEYGYPSVDEAMTQLKEVIKRYGKKQCFIIIHGYGSSGVGGSIRKYVRQWLNAQVRNGKIKYCISGEDFGIFNSESREICGKYSGLEKYKDAINHGITIVEV